jgi:hypothetical protein
MSFTGNLLLPVRLYFSCYKEVKGSNVYICIGYEGTGNLIPNVLKIEKNHLRSNSAKIDIDLRQRIGLPRWERITGLRSVAATGLFYAEHIDRVSLEKSLLLIQSSSTSKRLSITVFMNFYPENDQELQAFISNQLEGL